MTTGHKSMTVLRRYIREENLFNENAAAAVGLRPPRVVTFSDAGSWPR